MLLGVRHHSKERLHRVHTLWDQEHGVVPRLHEVESLAEHVDQMRVPDG
jgi:hypothetical protein